MLYFLDISWKTNKKLLKTRPVATELFSVGTQLTDGQTDITMLIVRFRIFENASKNI
jgi:hypothetical protein